MLQQTSETLQMLQTQIGLPAEYHSFNLSLLDANYPKYLKDIRITIGNAMKSEHLLEKEAVLIAFAVAVNARAHDIQQYLFDLSIAKGATTAEMAEVISCVSLLRINNVYYRFRHFVGKEFYQNAPAGIKMSIMLQPLLGKEFFEILSLCISALNGCENCVKSHEDSLVKLGTSPSRIHDAIRISASLQGFLALV